MRGGLAIVASIACAFAVQGALHAQEQAQTQGGYYDLKDYSYFTEQQAKPANPTPTPTPTPATQASIPPPVAASAAPSVVAPKAAIAGNPTAPAAAAAGVPYVYPKGDLAKAKADAKALATPARQAAAGLPTGTDLGSTIPGYTAASQPGTVYADDPVGLSAAGTSAAGGNDAWRTVTNPARKVVTVAPSDLAGAKEVEKDPNSFLSGQALGAADGSCKPLPGPAGTDYYEASCNAGTKVEEGEAMCRTPLVMDVTPGSTKYIYTCENWAGRRPFSNDNTPRRCTPAFNQPVSQGICRERSRTTVFYDVCRQGTITKCFEPDIEEGEEITYECDSPAVARSYATEVTGQVVNERRDETMCNAATAGKTCELKTETCVDPDPSTRTVNGVEVTRACWNWERTYSCTSFTQASDCGELAANPKCTYVRDECLDDPQVGPCKVSTKVYKCPVPTKPADGTEKYICGDDVYCINGDCEPVEREASTEFKDAVVGLHVLGQANAEFDEATLTLFSGTRETCSKKIFGASNCCSGKGVPLLTPFLCSSAERQLDQKDDKGLCHKVGSYCSDKVLGICVTSKDAYCCFESKLSRILQEQGRPQLGKPWGKPKTETCKGFTIDEFSRLDLSVMDFTEVYAEFTDAARLPDELETSKQIQERIQAYYDAKAKK